MQRRVETDEKTTAFWDTPPCKNKVNLSRYRHAGDKGERSYGSYSFLTSALDGVSGASQAPAAL
jgi:hypothetical protein